MKRKLTGGLTAVSLGVFIQDTSSTTGGGLASVAHNSSGLVVEYLRSGDPAWTPVTMVAGKTLGTYLSGGIVASGALVGRYQLDIPDAAFATGARAVEICVRGVAHMLPVLIECELDAIDYQDKNAAGLTSIRNIEAAAL